MTVGIKSSLQGMGICGVEIMNLVSEIVCSSIWFTVLVFVFQLTRDLRKKIVKMAQKYKYHGIWHNEAYERQEDKR